VNAIRGAYVYAKRVFDAGVGNHISHDGIVLNMNGSLSTLLEVESIEKRISGAVMEGRGWCPYVTPISDEDHSTGVGSGGKKMGNET
jgi:hypothetical protein